MKKILGIELGSTRIKSVLINEQNKVLAQGSYEWKSKLVNGLWSYLLEEVERGVKASYKDLLTNYKKESLCNSLLFLFICFSYFCGLFQEI